MKNKTLSIIIYCIYSSITSIDASINQTTIALHNHNYYAEESINEKPVKFPSRNDLKESFNKSGFEDFAEKTNILDITNEILTPTETEIVLREICLEYIESLHKENYFKGMELTPEKARLHELVYYTKTTDSIMRDDYFKVRDILLKELFQNDSEALQLIS
ncbi:MAG: hypothetical protein JO129_03540 [Candidatus Dependentiae bacterium]|nr:hypothetical protein [Candidatus Dependentiae bacterium]